MNPYVHQHIINSSYNNRLFWLILSISGVFLFSFSISNIIYFNKLHNSLPPNITPSETRVMTIINGIFIGITAVITLYAIYRLNGHTQKTIDALATQEHFDTGTDMYKNPAYEMPG